ncbi:FlgB family protein [Paracoccus methylarcula]|uniref:Flagellar basal body rod protein FlgB n=1 Tax=Paracoccus methylarcula TaxID=72022 RepID=A0A3R7Q3E4_9RHOB|nr:FlgB family protein [Paracoccus methylarcula]RNF35183.1 flagellar basal body rod protein FlgB [Paracoccus methylarcula]
MFERIELMNMARAMTDHAVRRNTVVARNIANADTPGFKTRDLQSFADSYRRTDPPPLRTSRSGHVATPFWSAASPREVMSGTRNSPNGNSVSLEEEMLKLAETKREHDLSLGIYRSALTLMRTSIDRRN